MEKMIKPAEYAKELGISRQAVYAKIKRGILTAKNVDGKLYIMVDKITRAEPDTTPKETVSKPAPAVSTHTHTAEMRDNSHDYKALLQAKDETISVLKGTVKDLKKSNKQISSTLKGEIDLLKDAFYEMRTLYVRQLEHKKSELEERHEEEAIEVMMEEEQQEKEEWIGLKKFFKQHKLSKEKQQEKIEKRLKKVYKQGDKRVRSEKGKLKLNDKKTYEDILK